MKEIIINSDKNNNKIIMLVENGKLIEKYQESSEIKRLEGNIYIGKIQNVLEGMQAAFVDIGEEKNAFIHVKDILPKTDVKVNNNEEILNTVKIKEVAKVGMPILVQVKRDATNKKGARVSTHINLPGRYCVLMPNANFVTVSQKIEDINEKERLLQIVQRKITKDFGVIIRTSAMNKSEELINKDIEDLIKLWNNIKQKSDSSKVQLIYKTNGMVQRILIDLIDQNIDKIIVNTEQEYKQIEEILQQLNTKVEVELKEQESILDIYELEKQIEKAENRKVWLKCGGFITIDKTEALTAIDVNSGKYTGSKNLEQTVFTVNKEASIEIAKQLRLRDVGGIIIIDYIDMKEQANKDKVIEILKENLKLDRSKTQIVGFTELNLLEMTRKHMCSND